MFDACDGEWGGDNELQRAIIISTLSLIEKRRKFYGCVNALQRATIISTVNKEYNNLDKCECQCPSTGNSHFYTITLIRNGLEGGCQCPPTGNSHFYAEKQVAEEKAAKGVNAFQRATVIST